MTAADAGIVWRRRVAFAEGEARATAVEAVGWYRGPGNYELALGFLRSDGGQGEQRAPFELTGREIRADGFVTFFDLYQYPQLHLELVERAPAGLHFESESEVSREGYATSVLVNESNRTFFPSLPAEALRRLEVLQ